MEVKSDIMKIKEEPLVDKEYLLEKSRERVGGLTL